MTQPFIEIPLYLALGGLVGAFFFLSLRHLVNTLLSNGSVIGILGFNLVRLALAAALFWVVAQQGTFQLLAAFAGFMIIRFAILKKARKG